MPNRGIKTWANGEVLQAVHLNEYIMQQTVMVFDTASARNTALASVLTEGMAAYIKDLQKLTVYDGATWVEYGTTTEIAAQENRTAQVLLYMEVI